MTQVATIDEGREIARPINILVPLIREDLKDGNEAAMNASMPYYRAAGEKMIEAKAQMKRGEFTPWIKRTFSIGERQAREYMNLARTTGDIENGSAIPFRTLRETVERTRDNPNYGKPWHQPVREAIDKVDTDTLNLRKAELNRAEEREASRRLALQLIDIGYKALASKLHPDKGGSRDAMARLNAVRDRLKLHV